VACPPNAGERARISYLSPRKYGCRRDQKARKYVFSRPPPPRKWHQETFGKDSAREHAASRLHGSLWGGGPPPPFVLQGSKEMGKDEFHQNFQWWSPALETTAKALITPVACPRQTPLSPQRDLSKSSSTASRQNLFRSIIRAKATVAVGSDADLVHLRIPITKKQLSQNGITCSSIYSMFSKHPHPRALR